MDRDLILQKLESLRRCIQRVKNRCPEKVEDFVSDLDAQDIVSLNLSRAVQLCVDIGAHMISRSDVKAPLRMGETFDRLAELRIIDAGLASRMKKAVGFRNLAMHNYDALDWGLVHAISCQNLNDFTDFARAISQHLNLVIGP